MSILGLAAFWAVLKDGTEIAVEAIRRFWGSKDSKAAERKRLQEELKQALKDGRMTDAGFIRRQLELLGLILIMVCLAGCKTDKPISPIVFGERIIRKYPGEVYMIPALIPPAKVWYVIDDVGLKGWLGLMSVSGVSNSVPVLGE